MWLHTVDVEFGMPARWLLLVYLAINDMHSNKEDSPVHGCALHWCRDAMNWSEGKQVAQLASASFSCVSAVWKPTQSKSPPTILDCVHMQACLGTEQHYKCKSWPAGGDRRGGKQHVPSVKASLDWEWEGGSCARGGRGKALPAAV